MKPRGARLSLVLEGIQLNIILLIRHSIKRMPFAFRTQGAYTSYRPNTEAP